MLKILVNGEKREMEPGTSVAALLADLGIHGRRIAVERNHEIVSRSSWEETQVAEGDSFEIIELVGGG